MSEFTRTSHPLARVIRLGRKLSSEAASANRWLRAKYKSALKHLEYDAYSELEPDLFDYCKLSFAQRLAASAAYLNPDLEPERVLSDAVVVERGHTAADWIPDEVYRCVIPRGEYTEQLIQNIAAGTVHGHFKTRAFYQSIDWASVDWTKSNKTLSEEIGVVVSTVYVRRAKHAPHTLGRNKRPD